MNLLPFVQKISYYEGKVYCLQQNTAARLQQPVKDERLENAAKQVFNKLENALAHDNKYSLFCGTAAQGMFSEDLSKTDAYSVSITPQGITMYSETAAGLFYAIQTLKQILENYPSQIPCMEISDWADTKLRCDHFDLRTIYPTFEHLLCYIKEMASYKINGLLIEYEDKLPFKSVPELRSKYAFSEAEILQLLDTAYENFINVIPLQQSFGHLEYALKHKKYVHLREKAEHVAELCPLKPDAFSLVCRLIDDIAAFHPNSEYIHLGGDEVWNICQCESCKSSGLNSTMLFIRFINRLTEYAAGLGKKPIVWHDMLKEATEQELSLLDKRITIAVWIYSGRHMDKRASALAKKFNKAGFNVIGAPSVRCWDECAAQNYPLAEKRLENIFAWVKTCETCGLTDIIYTNWSASLALGNPYGLFETTRYLTFFANELAWNAKSDISSYPMRFLFLYHGIKQEQIAEESFFFTDYYKAPEILQPFAIKNQLILELLAVMREYEVPIKSGLPLQDLLFLGDYYPENEEMITFLKSKYKENYTYFDNAREKMQQILQQLIPSHMVPLYMHSRFYLPNLYKENAKQLLYK